MSGLSFNKKGTLAAYNISEGGSDWQKLSSSMQLPKKK